MTLWLLMGAAWSQEPSAPSVVLTAADIQAERLHIATEKKAADEAYATKVKVCYQKIAVNACKQEAQQVKTQLLNALRRRELVLNDAERQQRSARAIESTQERQSDEKRLQEAERRREAQELNLDKLQRHLEKNEQHLDKENEIEANREARAKRLVALLERQRAHEAKLKNSGKAQEAYQRKLEDAQQHRKQVEQDRAKRNPAVQPLPPRDETQP